MNVKKNWRDTGIYWILCCLSIGAVWFIRIVITEAIRMALKDEDGFEKWQRNLEKKQNKCDCPMKSVQDKGSTEQMRAVKNHHPGCIYYIGSIDGH